MNGSRFVFCEGADDLAVLKALLSGTDFAAIQVEAFGGKDHLRRFLKSLPQRPDFAQKKVSSFAIIRDADHDPKAAFQSVRDSLLTHGFGSPDKPSTFSLTSPRVGVFIVGGESGTGMIEDLCLRSVAHHPEFECVDRYFRCIEEKCSRSSFTPKARVRVWMASHTDHELYVGKAAERGYWNWSHPGFDDLKRFLSQV